MPAKSPNQLTLNQYQAVASGIPKYCPNAIFTVAGQTFTATQAVAFVESVLNAVSAVSTAKTAWADARLAEAKAIAQDGAAVKAIRENIALMFSNNTTTLAVFDITPKKARAPLSIAARAKATAKAKATRLARGTTSKKQKATVSGNVVGVDITPVVGVTTTSSASPTPPAVKLPSTAAPAPAAPADQAPSTPAQHP
jgi:methionine-rich copper-binding protein CopC